MRILNIYNIYICVYTRILYVHIYTYNKIKEVNKI